MKCGLFLRITDPGFLFFFFPFFNCFKCSFNRICSFFFFLRSIEQDLFIGVALQKIVLASATHHHKSATGIHMSLLS